MADIFLSYSREDEARIKGLVAEFEAQGWTVFWDRRIPAGETWRSYIGSALQDARCIVVAWSSASVESQWVAEEADEGKARRILVPVLLEPVQVPRGFREIQAANISDWQPGRTSERFAELIADLRRLLGKSRKLGPERSQPAPTIEAEQPGAPERMAASQREHKTHSDSQPLAGRRAVITLLTVLAVGVLGYLLVAPLRADRRAIDPPERPLQNDPALAGRPSETRTADPSSRDVQAERSRETARPSGSWLVVAGSFSRDELQAAERHRLRLARAGLDTSVIDSNDYPLLTPNLWVVAIGPFESRETAGAALSRVRATLPEAYAKMGR